MTRARTRRLCLPLLIAAGVFAAEPLAVGLHFALTDHVYCPEHHALAHVESSDHHHAEVPPQPIAGVSAPDRHGEDLLSHDRCAAKLLGRRIEERATEDPSSWCPPAVSGPSQPPLATREAAMPLLAVAPKCSPPTGPLA